MGNALIALARRRGQHWAEVALHSMSRHVEWPTDSRILSRVAWLEVRDLSCDYGMQQALAEAWITAAEHRWRASGATAASG